MPDHVDGGIHENEVPWATQLFQQFELCRGVDGRPRVLLNDSILSDMSMVLVIQA